MFSMDHIETDDERGARLSEQGYHKFLNGQYVEAVEYFRAAYKLGDARGANNLGAMLENGHGVAVDLPKAVGLFRYAADEGFHLALLNYGRCLRDGRGTSVDVEGALSAFLKVPEVEGMFEAGQTYEQLGKMEAAKECYENGISFPATKSALGFLLLQEGHYERAVQLFQEASALGDPRGLNNLGACLEAEGDTVAARKLFEEAAGLGFPLAFANLAPYALTKEEKIRLLTSASNGGVTQATFRLGELHFEMNNYVHAVKYLEKAVNAGCVPAKALLGKCYMRGLGCQVNIKIGSSLLQAAV